MNTVTYPRESTSIRVKSLGRGFGLLLALTVSLMGCEKSEESPTPTPDRASVQAASTLFAQPTHVVRVTPTVTPSSEVELALNRTIARMEQAVLAGDVDAYLDYVWQGDPVFLTEHTRWARDWQESPLSVFEITLFSIQQLADNTATARMAIRWSQRGRSGSGSSGGTTTSTVFYREGDTWMLAGERWQIAEIEGFTFYYFDDAIVSNRLQADSVLEALPGVHTTITRLFDFEPKHVAHIKMYDSYTALQNWTQLSVPFMTTWNQPGEAIKIAVNQVNNTAPSEYDLAREYTRVVLYEIAEGSHGNFPWWLEEGVAEYGGLQFRTPGRRRQIIEEIAELVAAPDDAEFRLIEWQDAESRPSALGDAMQVAVYQAFTLVHYVTETYGEAARNDWIRAIATDQTLDEACESQLGIRFEDLDAAWRAWLLEQVKRAK
jgi:hypothetical protein